MIHNIVSIGSIPDADFLSIVISGTLLASIINWPSCRGLIKSTFIEESSDSYIVLNDEKFLPIFKFHNSGDFHVAVTSGDLVMYVSRTR